jgi:hypothetical protein
MKRPLTKDEIALLDALVGGEKMGECAERGGVSYDAMKSKLYSVKRKTGLSTWGLLRYWECELFQAGLRELGLR